MHGTGGANAIWWCHTREPIGSVPGAVQPGVMRRRCNPPARAKAAEKLGGTWSGAWRAKPSGMQSYSRDGTHASVLCIQHFRVDRHMRVYLADRTSGVDRHVRVYFAYRISGLIDTCKCNVHTELRGC